MGNQQGAHAPSTTARQEPKAGLRYSLAPGESQGRSDLKSFTQDVWRASTSAELNGQLPTGASLYRVITAGGDTTQYIRTAASTASKCVTSGTYTASKDGNTLIFDFGATGKMHVKSSTEDAYWTSAYTVNYKVSSFSYGSTYTGVYYYKNSYGGYTALNGGASQTYYTGVSYTKSTLSVSGTDTGSGSATLVFTPISTGGGTVKYTPSVAETVTEQKVGYYTRIPASAETEEKTVLAQGSTATQSFAFEIEE